MIQLTNPAVIKFKEFLEQNPTKYIRFGVLGGGCSGFSYQLALTDHIEDEWIKVENDGVTIFVDPISYMYLENTTINYTDSIEGVGFSFANPAVKTTCGCGQSFSV